MSSSRKVEALILSRKNVGEADRLLTFFSQDSGMVRVIAKGVRRIPSRRGGHVEPLSQVLGVVHGKAQYRFLSGVETVNSFPALRADRGAQEQALVMSRIMMYLLPEEEPQPQLYQRLVRIWEVLPRVAPRSRWLLEAGMVCEVLRIAGVLPQLARCSTCSSAAAHEAVVLDAQLGGWSCVTCRPGFAGTADSISAAGVTVLQLLATQPRRVFRWPVQEELARQLLNGLRTYASYFTGERLPLLQQTWLTTTKN